MRRSKPVLSSDHETLVSTPFLLWGREAGVIVITVYLFFGISHVGS